MRSVNTYRKRMLTRACIMIVIAYALTSCEHARGKADELTVKLDNLTRMGERDAKRAQMRQFLWDHWIERRPANLFLTTVSKEGGVTHSEYRMSLFPGGTFLLETRFVRDSIGAQGPVIPKEDGGFEACVIERVQSENPFGVGAWSKVTVLPLDAAVPPSKYWLRFKGRNDTLITYF